MKSHKVDGGYLLVLSKDQLLMRTVVEFCSQNKITAGWVSGIGAVSNAEIGYYDLGQQEYRFQKVERLQEIGSLSGNISQWQTQIILHVHVVLSDEKFQTMGGHLKEATIGGTAELYLQVFGQSLERAEDQETGLKLIQ